MHPIYRYWAILVFALGGMASLPAYAQTAEGVDNFNLSPEQLFDATVVSVSKTQEKLMDAPAAVFVLTGEDIVRSGATSIPQALRLVPGVEVEQANTGTWSVSVRGFSGGLDDKLLVLVDGRSVYDPLFAGVYWDTLDTVLEDIDRIEVIRGPGASLWGANAVNGVINIITKKAADTQGNLTSVSFGDQDRNITEQRYGGTFSDDGYYRVYGKYVNRAGNETLTGMNANDAQDEERSGFRADWENKAARDSFTLQGDVYRNDDGDLRILPAFNTKTTSLDQEDLLSRGGNMLGRWTRGFSDDSHFTLQSYLDYDWRNQLLLKDQRTTLNLDAQYELPQEGSHKIVVGAGYNYSDDSLTATPLVTFTDIGAQTQIFSSFAQDKITLVPDDLFLTLGSKLEHNDFTGFEIEPNARLQWHIDDQQMAWASVAKAVRTPSRLEEDLHLVQAAAPGASFDSLGNPNLQSENLYAYEMGYRRQWSPAVSTDIATFYNVYHSLSTYTSDGFMIGSNPTRLIIAIDPINETNAQAYGGEGTLTWHATDQLNFLASYSLLNMHVAGPIAGTNAVEDETPSHEVKFRAQWDATKDVSIDTMFYYTSEVPGFVVPEHFQLDERVTWRVTENLQFALVGQDLLDSSTHQYGLANDPHVPAVEIGRSVYGNFTWRF